MPTKEETIQSAKMLQQGFKKHLGKAKTVTFDSQQYKAADINAALDAVVLSASDRDTKEAAYHDAVASNDKAIASAKPVMKGLTTYAHMTFGNSSETLKDFGLSVRTKREPTVKTKASAIEKATVTRSAGGTKGKGQKDAPVVQPPATIPPQSGVTPTDAASATPPVVKATGGGS